MEIYFSSNYEPENLFLMQIPKKLLDTIEDKDELIIKGSCPAILTTETEIYKLSEIETTNTILLISDKEDHKNKEILMKTSFLVDAIESVPEENSIFNLISKYSCLKYDMVTLKNNFDSFKNKYTYKDLFSLSELPKKLFDSFLDEKGIFEYNNIMVIFDFSFVKKIVINLLSILAEKNLYYFNSFDEIFNYLNISDKNFEKLYSKLVNQEKENILKFVFKIGINKNLENEFVLDIQKIKLFLAKLIFFDEKNKMMELSGFIEKFNKYFYLYIPSLLSKPEIEKMNEYLSKNEGIDNLYPYFKKYDLRFLLGFCIIYKNELLNAPVIQWVEGPDLGQKFEERLLYLFSLKKTWRFEEIMLFMKGMGYEKKYLEEKVSRRTRPLEEKCIFDEGKKINSIYLK